MVKWHKKSGKGRIFSSFIFVKIVLTLLETGGKISFVAERHKQLKKENKKTLKKLLTSLKRCDNLNELSQMTTKKNIDN